MRNLVMRTKFAQIGLASYCALHQQGCKLSHHCTLQSWRFDLLFWKSSQHHPCVTTNTLCLLQYTICSVIFCSIWSIHSLGLERNLNSFTTLTSRLGLVSINISDPLSQKDFKNPQRQTLLQGSETDRLGSEFKLITRT